MALFDSIDTIRGKAAEAAQAAAKKTKQLAEIAKSNVSIYSEEDKIKKAQQELGKLYYRDYVVGEEMDEAEYLPWCQQIDESKQAISDLRDYIEELKTNHVDMTDYEEQAEDLTEVEEVAEEAEDVSEEDFADEAPDMEAVVCDEPETEEEAE